MKLSIAALLTCLVAASEAAAPRFRPQQLTQGYGPPPQSLIPQAPSRFNLAQPPFRQPGGSYSSASSQGAFSPGIAVAQPALECPPGTVRKVDGACVKPVVNKNIFLYRSPETKLTYGPKPKIPDPAIDFNYVFIRAPAPVVGPQPIVVPPAKQKTLVYVLSEAPEVQHQDVIEVPSDPTEPEVFFINYNQDENPVLPGGIDLKTALSQSAQNAEIISSGPELGGGYAAPRDHGPSTIEVSLPPVGYTEPEPELPPRGYEEPEPPQQGYEEPEPPQRSFRRRPRPPQKSYGPPSIRSVDSSLAPSEPLAQIIGGLKDESVAKALGEALKDAKLLRGVDVVGNSVFLTKQE